MQVLGRTSLGRVGISGTRCNLEPAPWVWAEGSPVAAVAQPVETMTVDEGMQEPATSEPTRVLCGAELGTAKGASLLAPRPQLHPGPTQ